MSSLSASKIKLSGYDELFGSNNTSDEGMVQQIPITELYEFKNHPFRVLDDEKMLETVESIKEHGVLVPGIARPRKGGGYEIISGHRRKHASDIIGNKTMPMMIRNYSDDEATIIMVDSNIQREDILPSEKAKAYRMKYEALKHQGKKSGGLTLEEIGEAAGENPKTVQRYIWISRLSEGLLSMVDNKRLGFSQGIDISFLSDEAQQWIEDAIVEKDCNVSLVQSAKLKEYGKNGELTPAMVRLILTEEKSRERKFTIKSDKINRYFSEGYSNEDIEKVIISLLDKWKEEGEE
jgi:ParB family chromosome partitioning protein